MGERDQAVRREVIEYVRANPAAQLPIGLSRELSRVDADNLAQLKSIVEAHGWPAISVVGADAARAAFLVAQHADADPRFQARVLELMEPLVAAGEVAAADYALLTDRVLVARGEPQRFGTQYRTADVDGVIHFGPSTPIADPERLDERRAALDLPPHADYVRQLRGMLGVPEDAPSLPEG